MRKIFSLTVILLALSISTGWPFEKTYTIAPSELPNVTREMKTAGFWISHHSSPDKVILTPQEIESFNQTIQNDLKLIKDITTLGEQEGPKIKKELAKTLIDFIKKNFYRSDGHKAKSAFYDEIKIKMNFNKKIGRASCRERVCQYV